MSAHQRQAFERAHTRTLTERLREPRRFLQVVTGARQVGKTTVVHQVLDRLKVPTVFVSADEPAPGDTGWLAAQWDRARVVAGDAGKAGAVLALDEVQKIPRWSETVKRLWDEDSRARRPLKVILLGSAPLLVQHGLRESLAGRFEVVQLPHWSYTEMRAAFGFSLEQFLYFGGYPGAAALVDARPQSSGLSAPRRSATGRLGVGEPPGHGHDHQVSATRTGAGVFPALDKHLLPSRATARRGTSVSPATARRGG